LDGLPPAGTSIPFHGRKTDVESQAKQLRKHPAVLDYSPAKHADAKCVDIGIIEVSPISRIDIAAIHVR